MGVFVGIKNGDFEGGVKISDVTWLNRRYIAFMSRGSIQGYSCMNIRINRIYINWV